MNNLLCFEKLYNFECKYPVKYSNNGNFMKNDWKDLKKNNEARAYLLPIPFFFRHLQTCPT